MRNLLKIVVWVLAGVVILALGTTAVGRVIAGRHYNRYWTTHYVSFVEMKALWGYLQTVPPRPIGDR